MRQILKKIMFNCYETVAYIDFFVMHEQNPNLKMSEWKVGVKPGLRDCQYMSK